MIRVTVYKEPCPKCKGTLAPDNIRDRLYHWFYCINCGWRGKFKKDV